MGAGEPTNELLRSFIGSAAVEGHERGWPVCQTHKIGTPAVGSDSQDLDRIALTVDDFFEAVYGHDTTAFKKRDDGITAEFYRSLLLRQAKRHTKIALTVHSVADYFAYPHKEKSR